MSTLAEQVAALQPLSRVGVTVEGTVLESNGRLYVTDDDRVSSMTVQFADGAGVNPLVTAVRVITPAEPSCPFEMGATVYLIDGKGVPLTVESWKDGWLWITDGFAGTALRPERLSLTMPEPPIGSIVADGKDVAWQRGYGGLWWAGGFPEPEKWAELLLRGPLTVIRWGGAK